MSSSMALVPYHPSQSSSSKIVVHQEEAPVEAVDPKMEALYRKSQAEARYLQTYKALQLGTPDTLESRMIRSASLTCPTHSKEETAERLAK